MLIRDENDKPYLQILRHLFSIDDDGEIRRFITDFDENDPDYDVFMERLKELVDNDDLNIIEEMIYDEDLLPFSRRNDGEFDVEEFEEYLYTGRYNEDPLEDIPEEKDEFDINSDDPLDDLLGEFGN